MKKTPMFVAACLVVLGSAGAANAQPKTVHIVDFGHSGSGCPAGSVDASITNDGEQLFVGFDSFVAQTVPGGPTLDRKNCQLRVKFQFDPAWSFSIVSVDYRGFAGLLKGVLGEQQSTYFFAGQPPMGDAFAKTRLIGPFYQDYARRDDVGLLVFSPCGPTEHDLVINAQVRVLGKEGLMTVDSITNKVQHTYNLKWKPCH
jgi:hypothetical protein